MRAGPRGAFMFRRRDWRTRAAAFTCTMGVALVALQLWAKVIVPKVAQAVETPSD